MADPGDGRPSLRGRLLIAGAGLLAVLPERPLVAAADSVGELWYRFAPARAAQARANLRRVCEDLAATERGPRRARRAATEPRELERLVRACFRHTVRYYLEVARAARYDIETALARMDVETPEVVRVALQSGGPAILLGLHFGAIELPTVFMAHHLGRPVTAPMETVSDPAVARWFRESRSRVGANLVPVVNARRALLDALRRGDSVGLVNDRDLTGGGLLVPFFGAPAPIPPGAALLAIETGVPMYVAACRRTSGGRYAGKLVHVPAPVEGTRRERMTELTARIAATFETIIADAPEQWWGAFHPIWPDLVVAKKAETVAG
jgi:phosphatidylinositol dimannoside acyltransferase